jgi:hypothetical protein
VGIAVRATMQAEDEVHRWHIPSVPGQPMAVWMIDLQGDYTVEAFAPGGWLMGAASSGGAGDLALLLPRGGEGDYLITVAASETEGTPYRLVVTVEAESE